MKPGRSGRPLLTRTQLMMLVAGLGLALAMAPQLIVPRAGMTGYLMLVALAAVVLATMARPSKR